MALSHGPTASVTQLQFQQKLRKLTTSTARGGAGSRCEARILPRRRGQPILARDARDEFVMCGGGRATGGFGRGDEQLYVSVA